MTQRGDDGNTVLATSREYVDALNTEFYSSYTYPWAPSAVDKLTDPHFDISMMNQSIGDWNDEVIPASPEIWVAGCGTNQAVMTALRFPTGKVLGSDLSPKSLEACADTARQVEAANLELKQESISDAGYTARFDHIKCTGVIHHTADPEATLACLAAALKPGGVLELMVYNRYHRTVVSAAQRAVRILENAGDQPNFKLELDIAKQLARAGAIRKSLNDAQDHIESNDAALADMLIQPVEYGYTVESLENLAERCGLEFVAPCINQFDQASGRWMWNLNFQDPDLRARYESLPDTRRWQVTNLLNLEESPLLWFYLQRKDSGRRKLSEQEMCEAFLNRAFLPAQTEREIYIRKGDRFERASARRSYPISHPDPLCRKVIESAGRGQHATMRAILSEVGGDSSFYAVNRLRLMLTTLAFPYLRATQ